MNLRSRTNIAEVFESLAVALGIRSMLGHNDFVRELATLKLLHIEFDIDRYAQELAAYVRATITILTETELTASLTGVDDLDPQVASVVNKAIREEGLMGTTRYYSTYRGSKRPHFLIVVADDLSYFLKRYTICHELGHIAACHAFTDREFSERAGVTVSKQPAIRQLSKRRPFTKHSLKEDEANLRARYTMLAADLGPLFLEKDSLNQVY